MTGQKQPAVLSAEAVRAAARAVGFTLVGVARAERLPPAPLTDWLQAGFAADMEWMHRRVDERLDPGQVLSGARTVVALAIAYRRAAGEWSRVAKYARGGDYHNTHRVRLKRLRKHLLALDGTLETYACVDTGVAMEKVWAERAGLGFIGKNGLLINRVHGSWLTLSVMFLDRAVDTYDLPGENLCGTCTRCLTSCPTEAFPRPGVVDARRCIAYQSIENRDVVPLPLRRGFAGRVFGCDICADVCPFNLRNPERVPETSREEVGRAEPVLLHAININININVNADLAAVSEPALRPLAGMTPAQMAALTEVEFERLAAGTALARAQYDGLRRNALLALGCARERSARALVLALLRDDPSPVVREAAAWALGQIDGGGGDGRGDEPALPS